MTKVTMAKKDGKGGMAWRPMEDVISVSIVVR